MPGGTDRLLVRTLLFLRKERLSWNADGPDCRVVFGTLLGPEATGPGGDFRVLFVSGFLAAAIMHVSALAGCVCGVCGTGLLFENYIVDASIFYKKQFPRI